MNFGVWMRKSYNDYNNDFYAMFEDIMQLEHSGPGDKVVLFKCYWYDNSIRLKHNHHSLVGVTYKSRMSLNDPFVLTQCLKKLYCIQYIKLDRNMLMMMSQ